MSKQARIFQCGDKVLIEGKVHIIENFQQPEVDVSDFEYSTNKGAWFSHEDITLLEKTNSKLRAKLVKDLEGE